MIRTVIHPVLYSVSDSRTKKHFVQGYSLPVKLKRQESNKVSISFTHQYVQTLLKMLILFSVFISYLLYCTFPFILPKLLHLKFQAWPPSSSLSRLGGPTSTTLHDLRNQLNSLPMSLSELKSANLFNNTYQYSLKHFNFLMVLT